MFPALHTSRLKDGGEGGRVAEASLLRGTRVMKRKHIAEGDGHLITLSILVPRVIEYDETQSFFFVVVVASHSKIIQETEGIP